MTFTHSTYIAKTIAVTMLIASTSNCWGAASIAGFNVHASHKLILASLHGFTPLVKQLVDKKNANVNFSDSRLGHNPLTAAVSRNQVITTKTLIDLGAQIATYNANGHNALQLAAACGNIHITKMLIAEYLKQLECQYPKLKSSEHINLNNDTTNSQSTTTTAQHTLTNIANNLYNNRAQTQKRQNFHAFINSALYENNLKKVSQLDPEIVSTLHDALEQNARRPFQSSL